MKKLTLSLALFACTMAAQAQNAGDYVYTDDGRYKITSGENLLSNGDFSQGLDGWLTDGGTPVNTDTFYVDKGGPDGGDCLFVNMKENGPGTGSSLWRSVPVQAGTTYYIAYSVQGYEPTTTTVSVGENVKNYQNIFFNTNQAPRNACVFIFDAYGEYHSAFKDISKKVPELSFKAYTTNVNISDTEILKIPLWLLTVDDIALLLNAESPTQLPIIEKTLKLVGLFVRDESEVIKQKNDIIARAVLDILSSGKNAAQIRDQIFSILSSYHTKDLNLETQIYQPGYVRSLKQCLIIDASGKLREMELLTNFMQSFLDDSIELSMPDGSFMYGLEDLKMALDFALLSEGAFNSNKVYDENNVLKVRLHTLINGDYARYFECDRYVTRDEYIKELLMAPNGRKAQIINFNINYVDDRFAKIITKIYSKLLFDYAKNLKQRASIPFHIILEEAHRYVQNDNDVNLLGYNIFERITKEGRKYGVLLGLISQRPSDLSETSISQCSNFLIFKMLHPRDIQYIRDMVPNITNEIVKRLRILQPGNCIGFGSAFHVPVIIKMDKPNPAPSSSSCDISANWFIDRE